ncbi:hypothetical protein [Serinibacter arcticus]|uniref:hypothetical protein n=1 Tax=Serinibacter arcticus TaxID=1655435 RepID=UPI001304DF02|nr:hypothetical protein [Serinibacter arcticus]
MSDAAAGADVGTQDAAPGADLGPNPYAPTGPPRQGGLRDPFRVGPVRTGANSLGRVVFLIVFVVITVIALGVFVFTFALGSSVPDGDGAGPPAVAWSSVASDHGP